MTVRLDAMSTGAEPLARLLLRNLTDVFDERDAERRRAAIAELWAPEAVFVDPEGRFVGHEELDSAIARLHAKMPTHRFAAAEAPQTHRGGGLLHWTYRSEDGSSVVSGEDVAVVADGKIVALYTYLHPSGAVNGDAAPGVREVVEAFFAASAEGDPAGAAALFAEEVDWLIPGNEQLPWTGHRARKEDIPEVMAIIGGLHVPGESEAETYKILVDGPDAVVLGRIAHTVKSTGTRYSMLVAFHLTVAEGKIVRLHMYEDTYLVSRAVGAIA